MGSPTQGIEGFFLKIIKGIVLLIMGLALVSILFLCVNAAYQYSQTPKEPAPAQKAPTKDPAKEINLDNLKQFIIEQEKNKEEVPKQQQKEDQSSLLFLEDATKLYRCSVEFGKTLGAITEETDNSQSLKKIEELRMMIEKVADSPLFGESYVKSATAFTCMALASDEIVTLKKDKKFKGIFYSILEFHRKAWKSIQDEKVQFEQKEKERVISEEKAENLRVLAAKANAVTSLIAAGCSFAIFMILALYLLASKIENNLRDINNSIRESGREH
jgi:hypothetical protein